MTERSARRAAWAGWIGGALAWAVQYRLLADALHFGCPPAMHWLGATSGIVAISATLLAGLGSWRAARALDGIAEARAHRFIARLGVPAAAFALVAIVLQTLATWIVPPCAS